MNIKVGESKMVLVNNNLFEKVKYIFLFVLRAFLISMICFCVFLGLVFLLYFGDLIYNVKSGNYKNPLLNGYIIVSQSMIPTIKINDAIVVKRDNYNRYNVGDIISFFSTEYEKSGIIVTHRIINKNTDNSEKKQLYQTKGDNNTIADRELVSADNIYGKVMFIIPKLGYLQRFLSKPINLICFIIVPSFAIILLNFFKIGYLFDKHSKVDYS